jgi:hypothetical protein
MRVNVYAEEMTGKVELVTKTADGQEFVGVRFWLYLPVSLPGPRDNKGHGPTAQGPFIHKLTTFDHDDDSSAVTFWGKKELRASLMRALELLDAHQAKVNP